MILLVSKLWLIHVYEVFLVSDSTNETLWEISSLLPACVVTHAMDKQAEKQSLLLADDLAKSHIVDVSNDNDLHDNCSTDDHENDANTRMMRP